MRKRKSREKNVVWRGGLQETFCWRGLANHNKGVGSILKRGGDLTRNGWRKRRGDCDPQRNCLVTIYSVLTTG